MCSTYSPPFLNKGNQDDLSSLNNEVPLVRNDKSKSDQLHSPALLTGTVTANGSDRVSPPDQTNTCGDVQSSLFGIGYLKCSCSLVSLPLFAVVLCCTVFFESFCTNGINPTNYQSLETRFSFSSKTSGIISIMYDVAYCLVAVPFSYLGTRYLWKPCWLAFGFSLVCAACVLMASPQFISGEYRVNTEQQLTTCDPNRTSSYCEATAENRDHSLIYPTIFSVANFLFGAGTVAQNTLAVHYLEENSGSSGFYYGIMQACRSLGSIFGAGLNAMFLTIPVDLKHLSVDSSHVLWVGAWWIGLCIGAVGVLLFIPVVASFPPTFNNEYTRRKSQEACENGENDVQVSFGSQLRSLATNLSWILFNLAAVPEAFIYAGLVTFAAKYFQQSLAMTASSAAVTFAAIIILGTCGSVVGALISRKLKSVASVTKVLMGFTCLEMLLSSSVLLHCSEQDVHNIPPVWMDRLSNGTVAQACFDSCLCSPHLFQPVCHRDSGLTYYSACYAGCLGDLEQCVCLDSPQNSSSSDEDASEHVTDGFCTEDCKERLLAAAGFGLFCFTMLVKVPLGLSGSLKLIGSQQMAALSLAITNIAFRVLGMSTGPLVFGAIMDDNCRLWEETCAGKRGSCQQYKLDSLSFQTFLLVLSCATIGLFFYTLATLSYGRKPLKLSFDGSARDKCKDGKGKNEPSCLHFSRIQDSI